MGSRCHDSIPHSYGVVKCKVCGKMFELGKWPKGEDKTTCISCRVNHKLNEVQYSCKTCNWKGCISEMRYVPPTESTDTAYYLCPKCDSKIMSRWCGEVDHWGYA